MNSLFFREFAIISLLNTRFLYEVCICYANPLSISRIHNKFTISYANSLLVLNQLLEITTFFGELSMNSVSVARICYLLSRIHFELIIYFANKQCIYYTGGTPFRNTPFSQHYPLFATLFRRMKILPRDPFSQHFRKNYDLLKWKYRIWKYRGMPNMFAPNRYEWDASSTVWTDMTETQSLALTLISLRHLGLTLHRYDWDTQSSMSTFMAETPFTFDTHMTETPLPDLAHVYDWDENALTWQLYKCRI